MNENKKYFYGNEISQYGVENGYVDYKTLSKCGHMVLCNDITKLFYGSINGEYIEPYLISGYDIGCEEDGSPLEIFQYYIVDSGLARILERHTKETLFYIEPLDMYIWAITHFGTSWDYVLTNIKIKED